MEDPNRGDEEENKNLPIYVEKQAAEDFSASTNPRERERGLYVYVILHSFRERKWRGKGSVFEYGPMRENVVGETARWTRVVNWRSRVWKG